MNTVTLQSSLRIVLRRRHVRGPIGQASRQLARALLKMLRSHAEPRSPEHRQGRITSTDFRPG